jgi:hypothetical protein
MNSPTISGPASQLLELIRESEILKALVEKHADLRELLIQAADAAAKSSELQRLFEAVAIAATASDREFEVHWSGKNTNSAELGELKLLASQANENLGMVLREFCPDARPLVEDVSAAPAN